MTEGAEIRAPATAAAILTQEEQNEDDIADAMAEGAYIATHYDGQLPAPTGSGECSVNPSVFLSKTFICTSVWSLHAATPSPLPCPQLAILLFCVLSIALVETPWVVLI